jgi:hypothetical protein
MQGRTEGSKRTQGVTMFTEEPCPHGVPYGCNNCIMRKGDLIASILRGMGFRNGKLAPPEAAEDTKDIDDKPAK